MLRPAIAGRRLVARQFCAAPAVAGFRPGAVALALAAAFQGPALAQPTGGVAIHGMASFASQNNRLVVSTQDGAGTRHSAINWQSFSIPAGYVTQFVQPGAASTVINRVVTNNPSQIFGTLISNGQLVLVNPAGIAVGAGAVVDTAAFTASTLRMSEADAIAGRLVFGDGSTAGALRVDGRILARSGDVVLLAPSVEAGAGALIQSPGGATLLAAGRRVEITGRGLEGIQLQLQAPADRAVNLGTLQGDAVGLFAGTLKHSGLIVASAATTEGGKVLLRGQDASEVEGSIQARRGALGGQVHVNASQVTLRSGAVIDVSGPAGGGEALVGGGWQGKDARLANAQDAVLEAGSVVRANATDTGNGGTVVAWADGSLHMAGRIEAKGGEAGGDGGKVETSGKKRLVFRGQVDTSAPRGTAGTVLLDPQDIIIANGTGAAGDNGLTDSTIDATDANASTDVTISEAALESNAIVGSAITLQASRDVIFQNLADDLLDLSTVRAGTSFVVQAGRAIAGQDPNDRIRTNGGNIQFSAGNGTINVGGVLTRGGSVNMSASGAAGGIQLQEVNTTPAGGNGGAVNLVSGGTGGIKLGNVDARFGGTGTSGAVTIDSASGAVTVTSGSRIYADSLQVTAGGGIGDGVGGAAATTVASLNAINNGAGDIVIANSGALAIADLRAGSYGVKQASGSGRIDVSTTGGALDVSSGVLTQGGDIALASTDTGVRVVGSTVDAAGGNVTITASGSNNYHAVEIVNNGATRSEVKTSGAGGITINGTLTGGGFSAGPGPGAAGVAITNSGITAGSGPIAINGQVTPGVGVMSRGFLLDSGAVVSGAGNITLIGGTRSTYQGSAGPGIGGYVANGATVSSTGGNVLLRGIFNNASAFDGTGLGVAGTVRSGSGGSVSFDGQSTIGPSAGAAVAIASSALVDAGALGFTVTGTTQSSTTATSIVGVRVDGGTITSAGNVAVTGTLSASSASGQGAVILSGGTIQATGAAGITITGSGVPAPAPAAAYNVNVVGTTLTTAGGQLKLVGDRMNIASSISSGTGDTVLTPFTTNRPITLGGTNETAALNLGNTELFLITAGRIVIGGAANTGGITIGNNSGTITLGSAKPLSLVTAGDITQTAAFNVARLHAQGAAVNLGNVGNQLGIASGRATAGAFTLTGGTPFEVGTVAGTAGITGAAGNTVTVQSNGLLTVSAGVTASGGTLALQGNGITLAPGAALDGGTVSLGANNAGALALGDGAVNASGNVTLADATSATLGNIVAGGTLAINGLSGSVTQQAGSAISAGTLAGTGNSGTLTLASGTNSIATLGSLATTGGLTVNDAVGDLAIAGAVSGGGPVLLTAAGSILQSQTVSSSATGDAVVLAAGADYVNTAGSNALQAPNGRWLVYSTAPGSDSFGGLQSGSTAVYNATYAGTPPASVAAGNRYVFAFRPTVTVAADARTRVYDGSAGFGILGYTNSPLVDASLYGGAFLQDTFTGALALGSSSRNVGSYAIVQGTLDVPGYAVSYTGANADITPAALTLAAVTDTRVYNGGTASAQAVSVAGLVGGDTMGSLTQSFTEKHVRGANGSTLQVDGGYVVNDGNGGGNYAVTPYTATGTITPAPLALNAVKDTRVYDGGTASSQAVGVSGLVGGDTIASLWQAFTERNVRGPSGSTLQVALGYVIADGNGGGNYAVTTSNASGTITPAPLALNAVTDSRVYDGTTYSAQGVATSGLVAGDMIGPLSQVFTERHVRGAGGSTLQVAPGYVIADGNGGANYTVTTGSASGTITPAPVTLSVSDISRVYDGSTAATGTPVVQSGKLFAPDGLSGGSFSFADRHVGTGKRVSVGGIAVNDGNGGANYSVTYADNLNGTITQRPLSTWTGAAGNGLWSSPGNWDALPDAANVLGVSIPSGASVTYDLPDLTMLQTLTSAGSFGIASGTLSLAGSATTRAYSQGGGLLAGNGSLLVTEQFAQAGGAIDLAGTVDLRQGSGNLQAGSIRAGNIVLGAAAGSIVQAGPLVTAGLLSATARDGIVLNHAGNQVAAFDGSTTGVGPLQFTNVGALDVRGLSAAQGDIVLVNTGAIVTTGPVSAAGGNVAITANSPLTVGTPGISATGDIVLVASNLTGAGNMTLEGDVVSSAGAVRLTAGANLLQKALVQGENGVTATAEDTISFGPNARTAGSPVSYTAGGKPVTPPTGQGSSTMQEAVQQQNQQLAGDIDRLETVVSLFADEAEEQRKRLLPDGIVVTDTQCKR